MNPRGGHTSATPPGAPYGTGRGGMPLRVARLLKRRAELAEAIAAVDRQLASEWEAASKSASEPRDHYPPGLGSGVDLGGDSNRHDSASTAAEPLAGTGGARDKGRQPPLGVELAEAVLGLGLEAGEEVG